MKKGLNKGNKGEKNGKGEKKELSEDRKKKRAERKKVRLAKKKAEGRENTKLELTREKRSKNNDKKSKNKSGGKSKNNKGKGGKSGKGGKGSKGGKGRGNKAESGDKKKSKSVKAREAKEESKSMGSLAGIATLRRKGDVSVMNEENHKIVTSAFTVGPLQLEVSKTYGHGKERMVKTAKASTDLMSGHMVLKVKPDGSAHVKKVVFQKPEQVEVLGSISNQKKRSDTYLRNSVSKMRPIAAQKILKTARYVLKAPSTVERKN